MTRNLNTSRLSLQTLTAEDAAFILELVNTPGWLQFIGDRNVKDESNALAYIQKILDNPNVTYWVVKSNVNKTSIGIITFMKRNYLEHHDIGFAFLPQYNGQGFAFEAAEIVLNYVLEKHHCILATTLQENRSSIRLLERLGFTFKKMIQRDEEQLMVYKTQKKKL
ncbi:GNAT family N-acetyltransferase [Taibaiella lutea]|uniref:GNAT family N-acetyltransferase n=1 Tax=Taibaiella lutea TaxID=2608001 RepID=A0A5M6CJY0_9BACT|nr:GNAT family N-acetyltransferase [Taibaiella lutea]KAA5533419.1 GNAT family N-acetyltransferase [Taibaiella lutea]